MKRIFDLIVAAIGLVLFSPFFLVIAAIVKADSTGPVFFRQERIGKDFRPFVIYKFRTMVENAPQMGKAITSGDDPRVTRVGRILRKTKLDELPQLFNILKGDMSFVGPRPELRRYVEVFRCDYEEILRVRPGLTDLASLKYSDEASILGKSRNPEDDYVGWLLPDKIELAKEYIRHSSFLFDAQLIVETIFKLFGSHQVRGHGIRSPKRY